jgi:hypothetical protein
VSQLTATVPEGSIAPLVWRVDWLPSNAREAHHLARVVAQSDHIDVTDHVGSGGPLPATDPVRPVGGKLALGEIREDPALSVGQYLAVELETTLNEAAARTALTNWALETGAQAAGKPVLIPLDTLRIVPLPTGGCWLKGDWLVTQAAKSASVSLHADPSQPLPGQWRVRRVSTYWIHEGESSY